MYRSAYDSFSPSDPAFPTAKDFATAVAAVGRSVFKAPARSMIPIRRTFASAPKP